MRGWKGLIVMPGTIAAEHVFGLEPRTATTTAAARSAWTENANVRSLCYAGETLGCKLSASGLLLLSSAPCPHLGKGEICNR